MSLAAEICAQAGVLWHLQRVKRLVRARIAGGAQAVITVAEVMCDDPVCPGPATQITILRFDMIRQTVLIHLPADQVSQADIERAFA